MSDQPHSFDLRVLQHEVAAAALSGMGSDEIFERVIDPAAVSEDAKAALRLFSLSFLTRFELRRMALERLRELSLVEEEPDDLAAV